MTPSITRIVIIQDTKGACDECVTYTTIGKMVRDKVESGRYNNASEVIREGLRLIEERDQQLERLRAEMQRGIDQITRGESVLVDNDYLKRVRAETRNTLHEEQSSSNGG